MTTRKTNTDPLLSTPGFKEATNTAFLEWQKDHPGADITTFQAGYFAGGVDGMLNMLAAVHPQGSEHGMGEPDIQDILGNI
jgi:hypothetical protein